MLAGVCLAAGTMAGCHPHETPGIAAAPVAPERPRFAPFVFLQAGDPQIGGWTSIEDTKDRFVQFARVANRLGPAVVVVVGDLVNDGPHEKELAAFDEALAEFRVPVRLIPGNHDDIATYRRNYGRDHYSFTLNNCEFVCLNSNLMTGLWSGAEKRREADEQWQWLEETLHRCRQEGRTHIFVVMHHPPATLPAATPRLDALFRQYDVRVVLSGHIHRTEEVSYRGYTTFTVAGTGWAADRRGFGYRLFHVYEDRVEQEYIRLDAAPPSATQPARHTPATHAFSNTTAVP